MMTAVAWASAVPDGSFGTPSSCSTPTPEIIGRRSICSLAKCGKETFCVYRTEFLQTQFAQKCSRIHFWSLWWMIQEPSLPWPLTSVSSSPKTLWDQKEPVLPAPQRDTIDDVQFGAKSTNNAGG